MDIPDPKSKQSKIVGDNVFIFTLGAVLIPALAVLMVGLHVLFLDGPHIEQEIQFLELVGGGGGAASGFYGVVHAWLTGKKEKQA